MKEQCFFVRDVKRGKVAALSQERCVARGRKKMVNGGGWVKDIQEKIPGKLVVSCFQ